MPLSTRVFTGRAMRGLCSYVSLLVLAVVARATIGASYQMQLGNPSSATTNANNHSHYLIQRDQYAMDYNDSTREPNWVSWDLTTEDVGSSGRSAFQQDTTLPGGFYQVLTTDYSGSGYDRGHMCPSADRTVTVADNQQVFYMSNMIPQAPDNNQGVWANFEGYCRTLASAGNEVLIICGPSGFSGSSIASGVSIPGYTWKIVVVVPLGTGDAPSRITPSTRVIAIKIPNTAGVRNTPWQNFVTSVAQIETDTGYTFFTALPNSVANALRVQVDGQTAVGAPSIVAQPGNQTTVVGGSATFTVTASGDAPLTYQWLKDDVEIPGATNASLTISPVVASDAGSYDVVVTNSVGSVTSNLANLIIMGLAPSVTTPPSSQTVNAGSTVNFTVSVSGSPTLLYQWRKNTAPLSGATNATLTLTNVQSGDQASYDVVVTNGTGSDTSAAATLTVTPAAPSIVSQPLPQNPAVGGNASFTVVASGTAPLSYQWRKGGAPLANGGAISGATTATLALTGVTAVDAGSYDCLVTNSLGTTPSNVAALTVTAPPPSTLGWDFGPSASPTTSPTSGLSAEFSGGVLSAGNNNGTTSLLTTSSVSSGYTGASGANNAGAAARTGPLNQASNGSAYFEFTLTPIGGKRINATGISFGMRSTTTGPQSFAVYTSVDAYAAPVANGSVTNNGSWKLFTPTFTSVLGATDTPVTFRIYGYDGTGSAGANTANWRIDDLKLTVTTVFPPPTAPLVIATAPVNGSANVDVTSPITVTFNEAVSFTGSWFSISSAANGPMGAAVTGGPTTFTLTPPSFLSYSDTITVTVHGAQVVDQASGTIHGAGDTTFTFQTGVFVPPTPPSVTNNPSAQTVNVGGNASFTVAAAGTAPLNYQWRKNTTPISGNASATTATLTLTGVTTADAGSYDCVVSNVAGSDVSAAATLTVNVVPPTITLPPTAQVATVGGSASFTVLASGTTPFSYQWRKNGAPITGNASAQTATLMLTGVGAGDDGTYDVVVTNAANSATSSGAALAVTDTANVIYWDFATATPTSGIPAGVSGGLVAQGNNNGTTTLLASSSASGSYSGSSGGNNAGAAARIGALNQAAGGSAYFEFTFTPASGRQFAATALSFGMRSTGTGPQAFALYTSVDGYTTPIAVGTVLADSVWRLYAPRFAGVVGNAGAPVTFRLFGYGGSGSPGSGTANWRIDDVKLTAGVLALPPTPPVVTTTAPAAGATNVALNSAVTVTFDQAVTVAGAWFSLNGSVSGPIAATASGGPVTFTLTPAAPLAYGETVTVTLFGAQVTEQRTNTLTMSGDTTFSFSTIPPTPPSFTTQPASQTATVGDTVTFTAEATGTAPMHYQWRKDGTPITDATDASLTLPSITSAAAGNYDVVASNLGGPLPTSVATLTVLKAPATVTLGGLSAIYDGAPHAVTISTTPSSLPVDVTYNGGGAVPVAAGSYAVVATINHPDYFGSATATLTIEKAPATVTLSHLTQAYDGLPKPVLATTDPAGLSVTLTYDGSAVAPIVPGQYAVVATIADPNYAGTATGTLRVTITALARHLSTVNGGIDGSVQLLTGENVTLSGRAWISGDLLVPGTPGLKLNGAPVIAGVSDGNGAVLPSNYDITLSGSPVLQYLLRRTDPIALPTVTAPPAPAGTRNVTITAAGQSAGDFATLRNLTLSGTAGEFEVPAGTYGQLTATGAGNVFVLGHAGATEPDVYNLQGLSLNVGRVKVVGPVVLVVANSVVLNGASVAGTGAGSLASGDAAHPEWLILKVATGGVTLNGAVALSGFVIAPNGSLTLNGSSALTGEVAVDKLTVNAGAVLSEP